METIVEDIESEIDKEEGQAENATPTAVVPLTELYIADASYCADTAFSSVGGPDPAPIHTMDMDEGSERSFLTPLLSQRQSRTRHPRSSLLVCFKHVSSRFQIVRIFPVIAIAAVIAIAVPHLAFHQGTADKNYTAPDSRSVAFQKCATQLSPRLQCPDSATCKDLSSFFMEQAKLIEINDDPCSWQSDFGLILSLLLVRDSLSLGDPSWHPISPLQSAKDVCRWKRIKCDEHGVVELGLSHDSLLNGTLPTELVGLVDLKKLVLFSNQELLGTIPSEIGLLTKMTSIQLHKSSIGGEIPSELASLTNLTELLLDQTELSGAMPDSVCALTRKGVLSPPHVSCYSVACSCCKCRNFD